MASLAAIMAPINRAGARDIREASRPVMKAVAKSGKSQQRNQ